LVSCILSPSLKIDLGVSVHLSNSVHWQLGNNVEWSIDIETEFFIKTLSFSLLCFVNIQNLPLLVFALVATPYSNSLSFNVFSSCNIKDLVVRPIDEFAVIILEDLPPS
jgi:hypothetical protein